MVSICGAILRPISACALLVAVLGAARALADDISGTYDVVGVEPSGIRYEGTAIIRMTGDAKAEVELTLKSGTILGRCMMLAAEVACYAGAGGDQHTLGIYRRQPNGELAGRWVHSGLDGVGTETPTPRP